MGKNDTTEIKKKGKFASYKEKINQNVVFKKIKSVWNNRFFSIFWIRIAMLAYLMNFIIESMNRQSVWKAVKHMTLSPFVFFFNSLVIFLTLTVVSLFRKRVFFGLLICVFWFALGLTNYVLISSRVTPFNGPDIKNISDGLDIFDRYVKGWKFGMLIVGVILIVLILVFLAIKSPKYKGKRNIPINLLAIAATYGVMMFVLFIGNKTGFLATKIGELRQGYYDYGFVYCFGNSVFNTGIKKPKNYSNSYVDKIVDKTLDVDNKPEETTGEDETEKDKDNYIGWHDIEITGKEHRPNIIYVQLESLFDPTRLEGMTFSEDPLPVLHKLREKYSSGFFSVPCYGAGTANTEFEAMTGMNLDDFGPGEYPYKTIMQKTCCESVAYDLKRYGYTTNALHDNKGSFYQRNSVFKRLGYDTFTSLEYIYEYEKTPEGWAKDDCLIDQIIGILKASDTPDYLYTISVEGHGSYPSDIEDLELPIDISDEENVTGNEDAFEYYVNMIHNMDSFVGKLIEAFESVEEDTIIVFYGDHYPSFKISDSNLISGDTYQTEYVIWNNFGMDKIDKDIEAYQLSAEIFSRIGLTGGIINQYHNKFMNIEDTDQYLSDLKILEYDILYGNKEVYGGELPYEEIDMVMGYKPIKITGSVLDKDGNTIIYGENFTWASHVLINGDSESCTVLSPTQILLEDIELEYNDEIVIEQRTVGGTTLSSSESYIYEEDFMPFVVDGAVVDEYKTVIFAEGIFGDVSVKVNGKPVTVGNCTEKKITLSDTIIKKYDKVEIMNNDGYETSFTYLSDYTYQKK